MFYVQLSCYFPAHLHGGGHFWGSKSKKNPTKQDCIYACVEKMDSSQSDESNYTIDTDVNDEYDFIPYSSIDARGVLPPHHCFFAHAVENLTKGNGQFRWLDLKDTIGFGTRANATKRLKIVFGKTSEATAYAENPSLLRSREYIENRQVSCEPMFYEEDLIKEYIKKFDGNGTRAMRHYWTDTEGLVIEKVGNKYRLYRWYGKPDEDGYNCCGGSRER
jgi:hypothetical protein